MDCFRDYLVLFLLSCMCTDTYLQIFLFNFFTRAENSCLMYEDRTAGVCKKYFFKTCMSFRHISAELCLMAQVSYSWFISSGLHCQVLASAL